MSKHRNKQKRHGICIFCGTEGPVTRDHIPPRCLFPERILEKELFTVPACAQCNNSTAVNDEYFRMMLAMKDTVNDHPDVKRDVWPRSFRGLLKPEQRRTRERLLAEINTVKCYTRDRIYIGPRWAYNVDQERLCKTTSKIGKALYWRETKILGSEIEADSFCLEDVSDPEIVRMVDGVQSASAPILSMGGDIFRYKISHAGDKEKYAAILLNFYAALAFFVIIVPSGEEAQLLQMDGNRK
jgi:hypothetical protein